MYPVTLDGLSVVRGLGIGAFHQVVSDVHHRLFDIIHAVVVHRRDEAIRGWRNWIREDPTVHPYRWLRPDFVPPAPFLQCKPHLTPGGSGVLADPDRIDEEFRKAWLPYFCRSGQRDTSLEEFDSEVDGWLPLLPEVHLPRSTGHLRLLMLFGVRAPPLVVLMVGVRGSLRSCLFLGMMSLLVFLPRWRILVFGLMGCWMLTLP